MRKGIWLAANPTSEEQALAWLQGRVLVDMDGGWVGIAERQRQGGTWYYANNGYWQIWIAE